LLESASYRKPSFRELRKRIGIAGGKITDGNAVIDKHGKVSQLTLLKGLDPSIDQAVIATVKQWRFTPATKAAYPLPRTGIPLPLRTRLTIPSRTLMIRAFGNILSMAPACVSLSITDLGVRSK
jgi:hypothetical protein